ncbi:hypothetical protein [Marinilactibacillus psychrotolerans]|uniref:hypothetical protein n=1 Tax=Marinilactibacillus psychrotolerans TaxID=191770 RepID=UPI003883C41F
MVTELEKINKNTSLENEIIDDRKYTGSVNLNEIVWKPISNDQNKLTHECTIKVQLNEYIGELDYQDLKETINNISAGNFSPSNPVEFLDGYLRVNRNYATDPNISFKISGFSSIKNNRVYHEVINILNNAG